MTSIFEQAWKYLNVPPPIRLPNKAVVAVFGRHSPSLVRAVVPVLSVTRPSHLIVSGNIGKDSGSLPKWGISEAHYIVSGVDVELVGKLASRTEVVIDLTARNGWENGERICKIMRDVGLLHPEIIAIAHATQVRRLSTQLRQVSTEMGYPLGNITMQPSEYQIDLANEADQLELLWEVKHMKKYGAPDDLVAQADEVFNRLSNSGTRTWSTAGR